MVIYVDDILIISHKPKKYRSQIEGAYYVNPNIIWSLCIYLGDQVERLSDGSSNKTFATSCDKYVKEAVAIVK